MLGLGSTLLPIAACSVAASSGGLHAHDSASPIVRNPLAVMRTHLSCVELRRAPRLQHSSSRPPRRLDISTANCMLLSILAKWPRVDKSIVLTKTPVHLPRNLRPQPVAGVCRRVFRLWSDRERAGSARVIHGRLRQIRGTHGAWGNSP